MSEVVLVLKIPSEKAINLLLLPDLHGPLWLTLALTLSIFYITIIVEQQFSLSFYIERKKKPRKFNKNKAEIVSIIFK